MANNFSALNFSCLCYICLWKGICKGGLRTWSQNYHERKKVQVAGVKTICSFPYSTCPPKGNLALFKKLFQVRYAMQLNISWRYMLCPFYKWWNRPKDIRQQPYSGEAKSYPRPNPTFDSLSTSHHLWIVQMEEQKLSLLDPAYLVLCRRVINNFIQEQAFQVVSREDNFVFLKDLDS